MREPDPGGGVAEDLVLIDIHFVEMGKELLEKVGVDWDDSMRFEVTSIDYSIDLVPVGPGLGLDQPRGGPGFRRQPESSPVQLPRPRARTPEACLQER